MAVDESGVAEQLESDGTLALKPGADQAVPNFVVKNHGRRALRLVGAPPTEDEIADRLVRLDDVGDFTEFAEPGSVSYQLMEKVFMLPHEKALEKLKLILDKVAGSLHLRPVVAALTKAIEDRRRGHVVERNY